MLSTLERWLQEEAHQKGQQVQVSQVLDFLVCRLYGNTPPDFYEMMCVALFPCDICLSESCPKYAPMTACADKASLAFRHAGRRLQ